MKTSKKFIAGISAFIVAISSVAITVSAVNTDDVTGDLTVSVSTVESVKAGEQFTVDVMISNIPETGIAGFEFAVNYDADSVDFVSISENTDMSDTANSKELELVSDLKDTMVNDGADYSCFDYYVNQETGKIACMWATGLENSEYWINQEGTLATITFTAKEDINVDTVSVGIEPILDDGSVIFATADESGNYSSYENLQVGEAVQISVDNSTTSDTETSDTETSETTDGPGTSGDDKLLYGDVNCDGHVMGNDLLMLKKHVLGLDVAITEQGMKNADVTGDGNVMGNDLLMLKKYVLGLIDTLGPNN